MRRTLKLIALCTVLAAAAAACSSPTASVSADDSTASLGCGGGFLGSGAGCT
jgi:hypothetical protein